jgi:hypothetical protein
MTEHAITTPRLLRAAAEEIERLEDELAAVRHSFSEALRRESQTMRTMYRRGYYAGHAAGRNGQVRETAPERHARGAAGRRMRA